MKIVPCLLFAVACAGCGAAFAQQPNPNLNATALRMRLDDFVHFSDRQLSQAEQLAALDANGYVSGASDEAIAIGRACPAKSMSAMQTDLIVLNFLDQHPTLWNVSTPNLIDRALTEAYPCKKR